MAKVMWLGEDELHKVVTKDGQTIENAGPSFTTWGGVKFVKGEIVELHNPHAIRKAKNNQFFLVEEDAAPAEADPVKIDADENEG